MTYRLGYALLPALLLLGCENMSFHTNLDPQNFIDYYKPSSVEEISNEQLLELKHRSLGELSGLACQLNEYDYVATEADARTQLRLKAADLGANAVTFGRCVRLEDTPACLVSVTCYGEAYVVDDTVH